jgi:DUF2075 family protein
MRLYAGSLSDFRVEVSANGIANRLEKAFTEAYRFKPSPNEFMAWQNSLDEFNSCLNLADLKDNGIILELQLPRTSCRLDAMVTGRNASGVDNAVIVELKQWQKCESLDIDDMVSSWVGGAHRDLLHPSVQARQYRDYLADMNTAFYEGDRPVRLSACAYLHNYLPKDGDPLLDSKFQNVVGDVPFFGSQEKSRLASFLNNRLCFGDGMPILRRIETAEERPSKKLLEHVSSVIKGEPTFVLLDEQKVVFERALFEARKGLVSSRKSILLVRGGPGTGKSVLAVNLLGCLTADGLDAQYATGSKAFTESMRTIVGRISAGQFTYFNSYSEVEENSIPVLVCDEAHRIRETSANRFTPKAKRSRSQSQVDELIRAAKVSVFFIDDRQIVRPGEVGTANLIREKAMQHCADLREFELEAQFRCAGSDGFVNWVDNTLAIRPTANQVWNKNSDNFDFRVFGSIEAMELAIRNKADAGESARLVAGFCWKWSDPTKEGDLVDDVCIGHFKRPWNAKPEARKLRKGIPKSTNWAIKAEGINQVGCVYTAQGFEFDYVGVIWGKDLRFSPESQSWIGDKSESHDTVVKRSGENFAEFVKNTYRVLLSRGMKGCYVYCQDEETAKFLLSRTEGLQLEGVDETIPSNPLRYISTRNRKPFKNCLPVYDLSISAGEFGEFQIPDLDDVPWIEVPEGLRASPDMFVAKVVGESMNKIIPSNSMCVFKMNPAGSRNGRIVLAQLRDFADPDEGGVFTVKRYQSHAGTSGVSPSDAADGLTMKKVSLIPESRDPKFKPLSVPQDDESVRIIAEFLQVL